MRRLRHPAGLSHTSTSGLLEAGKSEDRAGQWWERVKSWPDLFIHCPAVILRTNVIHTMHAYFIFKTFYIKNLVSFEI